MGGAILGEPRAWAGHPESFSVFLEHSNASETRLNLGGTLPHEQKVKGKP